MGNQLPEPLRDQLDFQTERVTVKAAPEEAFAVARTASRDNLQAMAGFHARKLILIVDEASAVDEEAYEVGQGALSTPGAIAILAGEPVEGERLFPRDAHDPARSLVDAARVVSGGRVGARAHRGHSRDLRRGQQRLARARRGRVPTKSDETVIPLEARRGARNRDIATTKFVPVGASTSPGTATTAARSPNGAETPV